MKVSSEGKKQLKPLFVAVCVALALEFAGCKEGTGGGASSPDAASMGTATNSPATNASTAEVTNAAPASQ
ncbi:MAG TPA: hypothetical protein VKY92_00795 [Verrucomicrobiae bacterium]|jgi:hypothetical protein|nr:hypothetical protein [Verrucomicrobiae bacterium]